MAVSAPSFANAVAPAVTVVLVAYNSDTYLARCLAALARQSFGDFDTLIIDNKSTDGSIEALPPLDARTRLVRMDRNLGFAAANNRAAELASTRWIAMLNPDALPDPDWLARLMAAVERFPDIVMFGSTQIRLDNPDRYDGVGDVYHASGVYWRGAYDWPVGSCARGGETFSPCAAAALYRRADYLATGGFDERFFCYGEDVDIAFRLRLQGHRALQVADAVVHHAGSASTGRYSRFTVYHSTRNRCWVFLKNMPAGLLWPLLPPFVVASLLLLLLSGLRGRGFAALHGIWDAIRGIPEMWRSRRSIQRQRRVPLAQIMAALSWSPWLPFCRSPHLWPLRQTRR